MTQTGQRYQRAITDAQRRADGKGRQIETSRGDVLSEVTRPDCEAGRSQILLELSVHQVHLPQVRLERIRRHPRPVLHRRTEMGIALDAHPRNEDELILFALRERVRLAPVKVSNDRDHRLSLPAAMSPASADFVPRNHAPELLPLARITGSCP
jgi:hypothetical protein